MRWLRRWHLKQSLSLRHSPPAHATVVVSMLVLIGFTSCQSTMSVEEAKKVTTSFRGTSFAPPPRTIGDITAILDQQKPDNRPETIRRLELANAPLPTASDPAALADFYF